MKKYFFGISITLLILGGVSLAIHHFGQVRSFAQKPSQSGLPRSTDKARRLQLADVHGRLPLSFEANLGQTAPEVKFLARGSGYTIFLTPAEVVFSLAVANSRPKAKGTAPKLKLRSGLSPKEGSSAILRIGFARANSQARISGLGKLPGKSNYFIGSKFNKWYTNVPTYSKIRYESLYEGVDLAYYGNPQQLEFDFIVAPGADAKAIRLDFRRAGKLTIDEDGSLSIQTAAGEVRFHKPNVYQQIGGSRREISGKYVLSGNDHVGFDVASYDATKPLIIDPVLTYSTFLGGSNSDLGRGIAVDSSGDAYVTGQTNSSDFPTTVGAFQPTLKSGTNAFVTKVAPDGKSLIYSTFLGGSGTNGDIGCGIAVDSSGDAYLTGQTSSPDFPTTAGAFQTTLNGVQDAFVTKLAPDGRSLVYSTFLGGGGDLGLGIALDSSGDAYLTGQTSSSNFPTTAGAFQTTLKGNGNAFVTKVAPDGKSLLYSTYLGGGPGAGGLGEQGVGVAVDSAGNTVVTGFTESSNFPTTAGAFQVGFGGGSEDAFVTKLASNGMSLIYSTYLGGNNDDSATSVAVDSFGNAYVGGTTDSSNFPTKNAFQPALNATFGTSCFFSTFSPCPDAFLTKLAPDGKSLVYSTYLGGGLLDRASGVAVDGSGSAFLTGSTCSIDFPVKNAVQANLILGFNSTCSAFVTEFNASGSALVYSTYAGGQVGGLDNVPIALDGSGNVYISGSTVDSSFPTTQSTFQALLPGLRSTFIEKIGSADAAGLALGPPGLTFPATPVGINAHPLSVAVVNAGSGASSITNIAIDGTKSDDFVQTNNCPSNFPGGSNCSITVRFAPTATGTRSADIIFNDSAVASPVSLPLTGTATPPIPVVEFLPGGLSFGPQPVGTTSPPQPVTVANIGSGALNISGLAISGANSGDFAIASGTTCINGTTLAPTPPGTCVIEVTFTPSSTAVEQGFIGISDNAPNSPQTVGLSGNQPLPPPPNWSFEPAPPPQTISAGQAAKFLVGLDGGGQMPFSETVSLACDGAPPFSTCSVTPSTVQLNDMFPSGSAIVTVATMARSADPPGPRLLPNRLKMNGGGYLISFFSLLAVAMLLFPLRHRLGYRQAWTGFAMAALCAMFLLSCGGGGGNNSPAQQGTPTGTYKLTVSGSSGSSSNSLSLTLVVK